MRVEGLVHEDADGGDKRRQRAGDRRGLLHRRRSAGCPARTRTRSRVAPSSAASTASSARVRPQILTARVTAARSRRQPPASVRLAATRRARAAASAAPGSGLVMRRSPTRNAGSRQLAALRSSCVRSPLSATAMTCRGRIRAMSRSDAVHVDLERPEVAVVHADDARAGRPAATLELVLVVHLDERARPSAAGLREQALAAWPASAPPTISSTASAPAARASSNW